MSSTKWVLVASVATASFGRDSQGDRGAVGAGLEVQDLSGVFGADDSCTWAERVAVAVGVDEVRQEHIGELGGGIRAVGFTGGVGDGERLGGGVE
jgi:hypothetical protein